MLYILHASIIILDLVEYWGTINDRQITLHEISVWLIYPPYCCGALNINAYIFGLWGNHADKAEKIWETGQNEVGSRFLMSSRKVEQMK